MNKNHNIWLLRWSKLNQTKYWHVKTWIYPSFAVEEMPSFRSSLGTAVKVRREKWSGDQGSIHTGKGTSEEPSKSSAVAGGGEGRKSSRFKEHCSNSYG